MSKYSEDRNEANSRLELEIQKRRDRGEPFRLLSIERKRGALAGTFWGNSWCENLDSWSDYADRLPRGKTYLRRGTVYDLTLERGEIFAYVTGAEIYEVLIRIDPLHEEVWGRLREDCAGKVSSLLELLSGQFGEDAMGVLTQPEDGMFPMAEEIHFSCTCPDHAHLCKHVAAVLYSVGVQLDETPELLFLLRGVDQSELVSQAARNVETLDEVDPNRPPLLPEDLSELFGIQIVDPESAFS